MTYIKLGLGATTLALIVIVSLWTPTRHDGYVKRCFSWPAILLASPVPLLVPLSAWRGFRAVQDRREVARFLYALSWFVLCYIGLEISVFPMMVPHAITIWQAPSPHDSRMLLLVGALVPVPVILCYTAYADWTFRGKVTERTSDHGTRVRRALLRRRRLPAWVAAA
jgi:cytochrome d ubiquinol oxidase subunit II